MTHRSPDRLLTVDLTSGSITRRQIPDRWRRQFIGGKGLGARYLYEAVDPGTDPLGPENVLCMMTGPLSGYLPGDDRSAVVTKSPLTGLFLDSYIGGSFVTALRTTEPSVLGLCLTGAADSLSILDFRGDSPEIEPAPALAGASVDTVDNRFSQATVVAIGPAGESGVRFATIAVDGGDHHAGRGGAGAVLGAKGLKAIVLPELATDDIPSESLRALQTRAREAFTDSAYGDAYRRSGTMETFDIADALSLLPQDAWQTRKAPESADLGIEAAETHAAGRERPDDPVPGDYRVADEDGETVIRGGTALAVGSTLGMESFDAVATLGATCDRLGLDVISAGNAVGLAVLASDADVIDRSITFNDVETATALLHEIADRSSPLGDLLAEGVEVAAEELGLEDAVPTVKSLAVPSFDPRGAPAMALAYATSDRGACHRRSVPVTAAAFDRSWTSTQMAEAIVTEQDRRAHLWCLIADDVTAPLFTDHGREWLAAVNHPAADYSLTRLGTRVWTLTRLFNVREGVDRSADSLPAVFRSGPEGIDQATFDRVLSRYYERREWDRQGRPSERLLDRLDLLDIVDDHTPVGGHPLHE